MEETTRNELKVAKIHRSNFLKYERRLNESSLKSGAQKELGLFKIRVRARAK